MHVSAIWWIATIALVLAITALDLVLNRGQTHITIRHATRWVIFYVVVALAFGAASRSASAPATAVSSWPAGSPSTASAPTTSSSSWC